MSTRREEWIASQMRYLDDFEKSETDGALFKFLLDLIFDQKVELEDLQNQITDLKDDVRGVERSLDRHEHDDD